MRLALLVFLAVVILPAQAPNTGGIRGRVLDPSGAAIAGAQVELVNSDTGFVRRGFTAAGGYYLLADLPLTGEYRIRFSKEGFSALERSGLRLRSGEAATIDVTLRLESQRHEITVLGTADGVQSDSPQLGARLDQQKIDNTPVVGRKLTNLALLDSAVRPARGTGDLFLNNALFVAGSGGRRQTSYVVDGSTSDDAWGRQTIFTSLPLAALQEFTLLTNSFSAAYGRTTGSVVNVNTRAGTNALHGDVLGLWRPPGIQARAPLSERRTADRLAQVSGVLSGPIAEDRTHFLVGAEYNRQYRDATVTSPLAPQNFRGRYEQGLGLVRVDHRVNERHTAALRLSLDHFSDTNPSDAVGGLNLPSAARVFDRRTYAAQLSETAILGSAVLNEAHAQFQLGSPITEFEPVAPSTQFVRPGLAVEGDSRSGKLQNHQWQWADTVSIARGAHHFKLGGDLVYSSSGGVGQEFGGGFVLGQFTLLPGVRKPAGQLTLSDVQRYSQAFGNASYGVREWLGAAFAEDHWRLWRDFSLNLGMRYEWQSFADDALDFSPRVGFAWSPRGDARTAVRGGYGIYYSQLRANLAASYRINGPEGVFNLTVSPGQLGFPTSLAPIPSFPPGAVLPPRDINVRAGQRAYLSHFFDVSKLRGYPDQFLNPRTQHWSVGMEREVAPRWIASGDYVHQQTTRIDRPLDLNAPAPFVRTAAGQVRSGADADATRPIRPAPNGYRRIISFVNDGISRHDALHVNLNRRFARGFSLLASYTYSHTTNTVEPDVPNQDPNDANFLGDAERGRSLLDQRHRAVISGWHPLPGGFVLGTVTSLASGRPYNITTGVDNNGDNSSADRPVVDGRLRPRNAGRGTPIYDVQTFAEREFRLRGEKLRISLRAEAFNLLNHANVVGRNGTWGNGEAPLPTFGQALGGISNVDPGRQFQFLLRMAF